jgi:hypothetical protein
MTDYEKLVNAVTRAGFGILRTSGDWSIHDVSHKAKEDEERELQVVRRNVELELEVERLTKDSLPAKWRTMAKELLERAAEQFSNAGCNDMRWPNNWSEEERRLLAVAMVKDNTKRAEAEFNREDHETVDSMVNQEHGLTDWWVMLFLGDKLCGQ